jgi:hypothetical protein
MNITIKLTIKDKTIELTLDEVKELKEQLDLIGKVIENKEIITIIEKEKEYIPYEPFGPVITWIATVS